MPARGPDHAFDYRQDPGMAKVVNLRTARKRAEKRHAEKRAAENRLSHGRPKTERALDKARAAKARRDLDQHRIKTGESR
jgi:hypothetical protein